MKLLREAEEGGLTLVADAEPSWWEKGDLLVGFPRPEQVRAWWEEQRSAPAPEASEHVERESDKPQKPHTFGEEGVRYSTEHSPNGTEHPASDDRAPGGVRQESASDREGAEHGSGLGKQETSVDKGLFGVFGGSEDKGPPCIHDRPGGKGCYLCDPDHPHRRKLEVRT